MISVGVFNGYYPHDLQESIRRIKAAGFQTVQLDLSFKDIDMGPGKITAEKCRTIRDAFRDANLPICCVSGYTNLVHPDPAERERRLGHLREIIRHARELGSPYVSSETGTFNPDSDWVHHPKNKSLVGYEECLKVVKSLVQEAYDHGAVFLVENYVNNVIGSIEEVQRLFADVNHSSLGLLLDPTNYFDDSNIDDIDGQLNRIMDALADRVRIAHAKDCKRTSKLEEKHAALDAPEGHTFRGAGSVELPACGMGSLNYDLYVRRLAQKNPNVPLIVEHVDSEEEAARAKRFVDGKLRAAGV